MSGELQTKDSPEPIEDVDANVALTYWFGGLFLAAILFLQLWIGFKPREHLPITGQEASAVLLETMIDARLSDSERLFIDQKETLRKTLERLESNLRADYRSAWADVAIRHELKESPRKSDLDRLKLQGEPPTTAAFQIYSDNELTGAESDSLIVALNGPSALHQVSRIHASELAGREFLSKADLEAPLYWHLVVSSTLWGMGVVLISVYVALRITSKLKPKGFPISRIDKALGSRCTKAIIFAIPLSFFLGAATSNGGKQIDDFYSILGGLALIYSLYWLLNYSKRDIPIGEAAVGLGGFRLLPHLGWGFAGYCVSKWGWRELEPVSDWLQKYFPIRESARHFELLSAESNLALVAIVFGVRRNAWS